MFCPSCRSEYRPGFYRCSDCDVALVESLPGPDKANETEFVKVLETQDRPLADIAQSLLRAQSIEFLTKFGNTDTYTFGFEGTEIWVAAEDEDAARDAIGGVGSDTRFAESTKRASDPTLSIQITRYSRRTGQSKTEDVDDPSWSMVEREIRTMDRYEKPIIAILTSEENTETDCMMITGGDGIYHLQIADEDGNWQEAVNPRGGNAKVDVWTSDQGFETEKRFTWDTEDALRISKHYWEEQKPSPDVKWN